MTKLAESNRHLKKASWNVNTNLLLDDWKWILLKKSMPKSDSNHACTIHVTPSFQNKKDLAVKKRNVLQPAISCWRARQHTFNAWNKKYTFHRDLQMHCCSAYYICLYRLESSLQDLLLCQDSQIIAMTGCIFPPTAIRTKAVIVSLAELSTAAQVYRAKRLDYNTRPICKRSLRKGLCFIDGRVQKLMYRQMNSSRWSYKSSTNNARKQLAKVLSDFLNQSWLRMKL